jgi:hypothetical protein
MNVKVVASFPVERDNQFTMNVVDKDVPEVSDDYSERMMIFANVFRKLAEEIESQHAPR